MYKLQVVSNLFLNSSGRNRIIPRATNLAIIGNLGPIVSNEVSSFLNYASQEYKRVFIVPSPREHFFVTGCPRAVQPTLTSTHRNIRFLSRRRFALLDKRVELLGVPIWPLRSNEMDNLYKSLDPPVPWTLDDDEKVIDEDLEWLISTLRSNSNNFTRVLLTYSPPPYFYDTSGKVRIPEYWRQLLIESNVRYWMFGKPASFSYLNLSSIEVFGPNYRKSPIFDQVISM